MVSIDEIVLSHGAHGTPSHGTCFMEAAAYIAGEKHSDHPSCVCPVIGAFARMLNDSLPDDRRQEMKPYVRMAIGTANDGKQEQRSWMLVDWAIRDRGAALLRALGLQKEADRLQAIPEIRTLEGAIDAARALDSQAWFDMLDRLLMAGVAAELPEGTKVTEAAVACAT